MTTIILGNLAIDLDKRTTHVGAAIVKLTGKEQAIVELLAIRAGEIVTKVDFFAHLYGGMDEPDAKILDVFICKLRRKLRLASGGVDPIDTVWGRGYRLPDSSVAKAA